MILRIYYVQATEGAGSGAPTLALKPMGSQPKSETQSTSGSTKWWHCHHKKFLKSSQNLLEYLPHTEGFLLDLTWELSLPGKCFSDIYWCFQAVNSDFKKKSFFWKGLNFWKKVLSWAKNGFFFVLAISNFRAKKGFGFKKKFFSSPISDLKCGKSLHSFRLVWTSHNRESLLSLWLISLHAQDGA